MASRPRRQRMAAIDGTGRGVVMERPMPKLEPGQVMIKVRAAAVSPGTELSGAKQARAEKRTDPGQVKPFGYQNAGDVIALGEGVTQFRKGDRVAAFGGGYAYIADYTVIPQNLCCKLPDNVAYEDASFSNLLLTAMQAIRRGEPQLGENLLVVGMGMVGQLAAQYGRLSGMYVMTWDTVAFRNKLAMKTGAHGSAIVGKDDTAAASQQFTRGRGFDMAVFAIGGDGTSAVESVKPVMKLSPDGHAMGRLVMVGGLWTSLRWGAGMGNLNVLSSARSGPGYHDDDWEHGRCEYPPVFMRWTTRSNLELALRLIGEGRLKVKPLITHRLPLEKVGKAVDAHIEAPDKTMGTVIVME